MKAAQRRDHYIQGLACTECGGPFRIGETWHRCLQPGCAQREGPMHYRCATHHRLNRHSHHLTRHNHCAMIVAR